MTVRLPSIEAALDSVLKGSEGRINFITGGGVTLTVVDNTSAHRLDVTIASADAGSLAQVADLTAHFKHGTGSPEGAVTANPGTLYIQDDSTPPIHWKKVTGTGNTGWGLAVQGDTVGGDLTGTLPNPTIAAGAVTASKVATGTLTDVQVAAANKDGSASTPSMRSLGLTGNKAMPGTTTLDQILAPAADLNLASHKIVSLAAPTNPGDAATKAYADALVGGFDSDSFKQPVRVATTGNITLSGTQTIDGVAVGVGDPVIVWQQTTQTQNGLYIVAAGAWTRRSDFDTSAEIKPSSLVLVQEGATYADHQFVLTTNLPITLGTTPLTFVPYNSVSDIVAGAGLTKTGTTLDVAVGTGILIVSDTLVADIGTNPGQLVDGSHVGDTTAVHGIPDTSVLVYGNGGRKENLQDYGNLGSSKTINIALANFQTGILNAANPGVTFLFTNAGMDVLHGYSFTFILRQDATGGRHVNVWPASVQWQTPVDGAGKPILNTAAGAVDIFEFITYDGGATWLGWQLTGKYRASDITFAPTGGLVSTDVQAAIAELDTDKVAFDSRWDSIVCPSDDPLGFTAQVLATAGQLSIMRCRVRKAGRLRDLAVGLGALAGHIEVTIWRIAGGTWTQLKTTGSIDATTLIANDWNVVLADTTVDVVVGDDIGLGILADTSATLQFWRRVLATNGQSSLPPNYMGNGSTRLTGNKSGVTIGAIPATQTDVGLADAGGVFAVMARVA